MPWGRLGLFIIQLQDHSPSRRSSGRNSSRGQEGEGCCLLPCFLWLSHRLWLSNPANLPRFGSTHNVLRLPPHQSRKSLMDMATGYLDGCNSPVESSFSQGSLDLQQAHQNYVTCHICTLGYADIVSSTCRSNMYYWIQSYIMPHINSMLWNTYSWNMNLSSFNSYCFGTPTNKSEIGFWTAF